MGRISELERRVQALENEVYSPTSGRPGFHEDAMLAGRSDDYEGPYGYGSQIR